MELTCDVKSYNWGKIGLNSKVAKLSQTANPEFEIEEDTPYAELWMGTHPSGPSRDKATGELLSTIIENHPEYLGVPIRQAFGDTLPYLFKILSIGNALSIQVHPSKEIAEELNRTNNEVYKDANHKPELAIALTDFKALCAFRPTEEIRTFMKEVRELRAIVGTEVAEKFINEDHLDKQMVEVCFTCLMKYPAVEVEKLLQQLLQKFKCIDDKQREFLFAPLIEELNSQFPGDVGCFAVYFLNVIDLKPFEAIYLGPNIPHAYISGDCVECMACSDNVIRAGLTPKFKDVDTLCRILDYTSLPVQSVIFQPVIENNFCSVYKPPVLDFAVAKYEIPPTFYFCLKARNSASILINVAGYGKYGEIELHSGTVVFIPANTKVELECINEMLLFQAMANVN